MIQFHEPPFSLSELKIEVTYNCNLNCIHCSSDARPTNSVELCLKDCRKIITEASSMGAKKLSLSGGEPLCWPHIYAAVDTAVKNNLEVTIYTSGNIDDFKTVANTITRLGAKRFIFSLFGGTSDSHERVTRVAGSFENTLSSMDEANNIGLITEVHFVPLSTNYREIEEVAILGKKHGAKSLSVLRFVSQGRGTLLLGRVLNRVQNLELRRKIKLLKIDGFSIRTGSPYNFLLLNEAPNCCAAIDRIIISPDLRLHPCDAFKQVKAEELVGTLVNSCINGSCLSDCWKNSPYLEAIRTYLTTPFNKPCNSCSLLKTCLSGCLAQKVVKFGNLMKRPDPDCLGINYQGD